MEESGQQTFGKKLQERKQERYYNILHTQHIIYTCMYAICTFHHYTYNNLHYQVFQAEVNSQQKRLEKDRLRKSSTAYKEKRKAARYSSTSSVQHHYGPQSQQPDLPKEELMTLSRNTMSARLLSPRRRPQTLKQRHVVNLSATCGITIAGYVLQHPTLERWLSAERKLQWLT